MNEVCNVPKAEWQRHESFFSIYMTCPSPGIQLIMLTFDKFAYLTKQTSAVLIIYNQEITLGAPFFSPRRQQVFHIRAFDIHIFCVGKTLGKCLNCEVLSVKAVAWLGCVRGLILSN